MNQMGRLGSNQLGFMPFRFVTEVVRGEVPDKELTPGFSFRSMGCYEFMEESVAGIDWFRWLDYKMGPVEVTYNGEKQVTVWVLAPQTLFEEAVEELASWVQERDMDTHEDTTFAGCVHEGCTEFQGAVAWWSLSDATVITLQEDVAREILSSLTARKAARDAEHESIRTQTG